VLELEGVLKIGAGYRLEVESRVRVTQALRSSG
jgi:hypothetical protein